jgi:hypothetical protein
MGARMRIRGWLAVMVIFFAASVTLLHADRAGQFPDAAQVAADYPDDAQQYAALNALWDYLHSKALHSPDADAKRAAYYDASTRIRQKYIVAGTAEGFDGKVRALDGPFGLTVLQRYRLMDVPAEQAAAPGSGSGPNAEPLVPHEVRDAMIKRALPYFLAGAVILIFAIWFLVRRRAAKPSAPDERP